MFYKIALSCFMFSIGALNIYAIQKDINMESKHYWVDNYGLLERNIPEQEQKDAISAFRLAMYDILFDASGYPQQGVSISQKLTTKLEDASYKLAKLNCIPEGGIDYWRIAFVLKVADSGNLDWDKNCRHVLTKAGINMMKRYNAMIYILTNNAQSESMIDAKKAPI